MTDKQTLDVYDAEAQRYATAFGKDDNADAQLQHFLDQLPEAASLLDLGCGPGRSAGIMAAAGHSVLATDASAEMVKLASGQDGVRAAQATFDDIVGDSIYDGVWANFSLLHAARDDLPRHLSAIAAALKPGGIFHIGMKTGTDTLRDKIGRRYTYVTEAELNGLLTDVGLIPFKTWTGASPGMDGTVAPWIVMQARKDA